jgi:aspartyl-tRNA(Asn)/glutamyl-tRNA(Gln) amidotransferase subunit B
MSISGKYEVVIGLEVHIQLQTHSKLFCADGTSFGAGPNTHISAITLGHPGTLPRLNEKALDFAIQLGLSLGCTIERVNHFARKHYFYPDLPKGFQTSQHHNPICSGGYLDVETGEGVKRVQLTRIHLEEDAGKSIHDALPDATCLDYNRAGTPLCELVTEPCIGSSDEAAAFVTALRKLVRWIGVGDGNMEEGSLRCDANISLRPHGQAQLGTRVEVKNLNSFKFIKKAIDFEVARMTKLLDAGETVQQETKSFDAATETTFTLRTKEDANDYRYLTEPDLTPALVSDAQITTLQQQLPALPAALKERFTQQYQLPEADARQLTEEKETADYFLAILQHTPQAKAAANWVNGPVKQYLNENNADITQFPLPPATIADMIGLIEKGIINFSIASGKLWNAALKQPDAAVTTLVRQLNLATQDDDAQLEAWADQVLAKFPAKVAEYQKGKKGLLAFFTGEMMKLSKGKASPQKTQDILARKLL